MFDSNEEPSAKNPEEFTATNGNVPAPDRHLQQFKYLRRYQRTGRAPWRKISPWKREDLCNRDLVTDENLGVRNGMPFPLRAYRLISSKSFAEKMRERFINDIQEAAVGDLRRRFPHLSASRILSFSQTVIVALVVLISAYAFATHPLATIIFFNAIVTAYFISAIAYRVVLLFAGAPVTPNSDSKPLSARDLPIITILLPLYDDANSLLPLSRAIDMLEYPSRKKDVKLLLEDDDQETLEEARRLGLDEQYEIIIVPEGKPRTKPKACNYGMHLARGDLIVIYDAEDQPESDQLLKAAHAFHNADSGLACVQAHLNYYNASENWLTLMFTLEYSLWFDWLLPGLQRLKAPIPLGGTSNFFRTDTLVAIGGWDPFNVTEDADLGLRLSKLGYRVELLDSTTFEEANCQTGNWIRQRSRWMKGYLQTWFVHMRLPQDIIATTGWRGMLAVQLFIAGNVLSALINPFLWAVFLTWTITQAGIISAAFPGPLLWLNIFALVFGNAFFILLAVIAPLKRGWWRLCLFGLTAPFYWLLTSIAAYKAVWQLFFRPHYWEKTDHQISKVANKLREDAMKQGA